MLLTQLPHEMSSNGFRNSPISMYVSSKVPSTTILQNKVNPIIGLKQQQQQYSKKNKTSHTLQSSNKRQKQTIYNLNSFKKSNDVRVMNSSKNSNLFDEIISNFGAQLGLINLLNGNLQTWTPMTRTPHHCKWTRPDSRTQYVISDQPVHGGSYQIHYCSKLQKELNSWIGFGIEMMGLWKLLKRLWLWIVCWVGVSGVDEQTSIFELNISLFLLHFWFVFVFVVRMVCFLG